MNNPRPGRLDSVEIERRFGYHKANEVTAPLHQELRAQFIDFADVLDNLLPDSREKSLAFTSLQETLLWCQAAVACNLADVVDE